ncbi:MAG: type II secretion system protein [Sphingomonadales bacterium]
MHNRVHQSKAGFTLLEVLIALVIAGLTLSIVVPTVLNGYRQTRQSDAKLAAISLGRQVMLEVMNRKNLTTLPQFGEVEEMRWTIGLRWQKRVAQLQLIEVSVTISDVSTSQILAELTSQKMHVVG